MTGPSKNRKRKVPGEFDNNHDVPCEERMRFKEADFDFCTAMARAGYRQQQPEREGE